MMTQVRGASLSWILGCAALLAPSGAAAQDEPPRLKVGVVDMGALFERYERKRELEAEVDAAREEIKAKLTRLQEKCVRRRAALRSLEDGSPEHERGARALRRALADYEAEAEESQARLKRRVEEDTLALLKDLTSTIRAYGTRHRFTMIFKVDLGATEGKKLDEAIFRQQITDLVFFDPVLDVTEDLLRYLHSQENRDRLRGARPGEREPESGDF